jgi:hypothetical protein
MAQTVRAKFKVNTITRSIGSRQKRDDEGRFTRDYEEAEMWTINMSPVYANGDPNHENSKFWAATPGGSISLNCVDAAAVRTLDLGKEVYVDFTPAE